ncbi:MAG: nitrate- and nitrite sensing domain-containing protein [SAR324 cluster bacterium]|nr:nitrate- and nitrite sensing domain-containing protein [SAR324 cluster bacterium]
MFSNRTLTFRHTLLLLFPLLTALIYFGFLAFDSVSEYLKLQKIVPVTDNLHPMHQVVHGLQDERKQTFQFLLAHNSPDMQSLKILQKTNDSLIQNLIGGLRQMEPFLNNKSKTDIQKIISTLDSLHGLRKQALSRSVSASEWYEGSDKIIHQLLEFQLEVVNLEMRDITREFYTYISVLEIMERLRGEQLLLYAVFLNQTLPVGGYERFLALVNEQDIYWQLFETFAGDSTMAGLGRILTPETLNPVEVGRNAFIQGIAEQRFEYSPDDWLRACEERIMALDNLFEQIEQHLSLRVHQDMSNHFRHNLILLSVGALTLLGIIIFSVKLTRSMIEDLSRDVFTLNRTTDQLQTASAMLAESSEELARGSMSHSSSIAHVSTALEQIANHIQDNARNSRQVQKMADQSESEISTLSATMTLLKDSSGKISGITQTIDDLAFQTNILSLNAAVEAARAGELGMGFSVVADEVRTLALKSAEAARDISSCIEENVMKTIDGVDITARVISSFKNINKHIAEIATASQEQTQGITQIHTSILEMDDFTQRSAATAEQNSTAASELSMQVLQLQGFAERLLRLLGLDVETANSQPPAPSPRDEAVISLDFHSDPSS